MNKQTMRTTIATSLAALFLGAALAAAPAFAQSRNPNDGGTLAEPSAAQIAAAKAHGTTATQQKSAFYGRAANDGGLLPAPSAADQAAAAKSQTASQQSAKPHVGRAPNDGGLVDAQ